MRILNMLAWLVFLPLLGCCVYLVVEHWDARVRTFALVVACLACYRQGRLAGMVRGYVDGAVGRCL